MKRLLAYSIAAIFAMPCAYAGEAEITRTDEVRVNPEVKRKAATAKKKTKRAAKKAKAKTQAAAKRTQAAASRAGDRTRAAADRVDVTPDNSRGEAVLERNR